MIKCEILMTSIKIGLKSNLRAIMLQANNSISFWSNDSQSKEIVLVAKF